MTDLMEQPTLEPYTEQEATMTETGVTRAIALLTEKATLGEEAA